MTTRTYHRDTAAAEAVVTADDVYGRRWLLMIRRAGEDGWTVPGGPARPDEHPVETAQRELAVTTGLALPGLPWRQQGPHNIDDPQGGWTWALTVPCRLHLGTYAGPDELPQLHGTDAGDEAAWLQADSYSVLADHLHVRFSATIGATQQQMLRELIADWQPDQTDGPAPWDDVPDTPTTAAALAEAVANMSVPQLREHTGAYLRLRGLLAAGMDDFLAFGNGEQLLDVPHEPALAAYITHLATAGHGDCDLCGRPIAASDTVTALAVPPWWHPRRWSFAWRQARRGRRSAHTRCAQMSRFWDLPHRPFSSRH